MIKNYCKWDLSLEKYNNMDAICNENHAMISGTTGSGKSVLINDLLYVLTGYDPSIQRIVLFDLKRVELIRWKNFPHVLGLVTEPEQVCPMLDRIIDEMECRYQDMMTKGLRQSRAFHIHGVIDELAEVLRVKGAEERIDKLLRLARASNIHLILATQNPSRSSGIPSRIYQNVSCCVGLRCRSAIESRQVIGVKGCEDLPQYGYAYVQYSEGLCKIEIPMVEDWEIDCQLAMYECLGIA